MWYLIATSLLWSFSFGLIKTHLNDLNAYLVAFIRLALSLGVFLPFLARVGAINALRLACVGALQFGVMYCLYIRAYQFGLAAHEVALLTLTTPVFVVLADMLLRGKWIGRYWLGAVLAMAAAAVVVWESRVFSPRLTGAILLQGANLAFALGQVIYKQIAGSAGRSLGHFAWLYAGALVPPAFMLAAGGIAIELPQSSGAWLALLYLGLVPSGLGFFLWNKGVREVTAGFAAVANNLKVPLGVLVSWLVFAESPDLVRLTVCAVLFAAAFFAVRRT